MKKLPPRKTPIVGVIEEIEQLINQTVGALYRLYADYDNEIRAPHRHNYTHEPLSKKLVIESVLNVRDRLQEELSYYKNITLEQKSSKALSIDMSRLNKDFTEDLSLNRIKGYASVMSPSGSNTIFTDIISSKITRALESFRSKMAILLLKMIKQSRDDEINRLTLNGDLQGVHYLVLSEFIECNHEIVEVKLLNHKADLSNPYLCDFINRAMSSKTLSLLNLGNDNNTLIQGGIAHETIGLPLYMSKLKHRLCVSLETESGTYAWLREENEIINSHLSTVTFQNIEKEIASSEPKTLNSIFKFEVSSNSLNISDDSINETSDETQDEQHSTSNNLIGSDYAIDTTERNQNKPSQDGAAFLCALALLSKKTFNLHSKYDGWYAIDYAVLYQNYWCVSYFIFEHATFETSSGAQTSLHIAAEFSSSDILSLLLMNPLMIKIIEATDEAGRTPVEVAIINNKHDCAQVLLNYGANPDRNRTGEYLSLSLSNGHFEIAKELISHNILISDDAKKIFSKILEADEDHHLKQILDNRLQFFNAILDGNLEQIKNQLALGDPRMIHWHDFDNHSALYIACSNKKYEVYGYLLSLGFSNKESEVLDYGVSNQEKNLFKEAALKAYKDSDDVLSSYLVNRTEIRRPTREVDLKRFYQEIVTNTYLKPILEVIEYATPRSTIYLDFGSDNIRLLSPTANESTMGTCDFKLSRIIVGAKKNLQELRGTTVHELTHLACQVIWNNDCLPYSKVEVNAQAQYNDIFQTIKSRHSNTSHGFDPIIRSVFNSYKREEDQKAELIVRIPHIVARDGHSQGMALLTEQVPELLSYYQDVFLVECKNYVRRLHQQGDQGSHKHIELQQEFENLGNSNWHWPTISKAQGINAITKSVVIGFSVFGAWTFFQSQFKHSSQNPSGPIFDTHTTSNLEKLQ